MGYDVLIRDNRNGAIVLRHYYDREWEDSSLFWWTEGNFGCDCNRGAEFLRGKGLMEEANKWLDDSQCGDDKFTVIKVILPDGSEVAIDEGER